MIDAACGEESAGAQAHQPGADSSDNPEALRRLALAASGSESQAAGALRYAKRCMQALALPVPVLWPRRTAGDAIRIAYLIAPARALHFGGESIDPATYFEHVIAAHARRRFEVVAFIVDGMRSDAASLQPLRDLRVAAIGNAPDAAVARALAEGDYDALIDLAGLTASTGALLAAPCARSTWTVAGLRDANVAPLISNVVAAPDGGVADALSRHRVAVEAALTALCEGAPWYRDRAALDPDVMTGLWRNSVAFHRAGNTDAALAGYNAVLHEQPVFAPALYLSALLLRDAGVVEAATTRLTAALAAAPAYSEARVALANLQRGRGDAEAAALLCREGLSIDERDAALWRALGLCELARRDARAARDALARALELVPADSLTHYNYGVALQMLNRRDEALRAYRRSLDINPEELAADFNIGVILQEQGRTDAAIHAFGQVLARDPKHLPAHKALGEVLLAAHRIDAWLAAFDRFEASCPRSLAVAVRALEVYAYRGDFAAIDRSLERLRRHDFVTESGTDLADCLEQLLYLLLYFDVEPETHFAFYRAYDGVAPQVYGTPLASPAERRPGRLRIGYLSGDLRNHVMGKMMWEVVRHHDRDRFEIRFYSTVGDSDEWTARFRGEGDGYLALADVSDREAATTIAAADLDILVDLSTHTKGSRPGILALKPARVQITHVASAGTVGLSAIDFKLTDAYADLPANQAFCLETQLPMAGCVYPYRHIEAAAQHPYDRGRLGIPVDAIVLGAFVNPMKLSRRCLGLWRQVLERIPQSALAISPQFPEARAVYARVLAMGGIPLDRVIVVPQGRDDGENQARYQLVDFVVDPVPYSGVNGTLEALGMGVPVVTLCGRKHCERTSYSILANLRVTQTVAQSSSEYVDIAVRLATDSAFAAEVRAAVRAGIASSPLTDMRAHTRNLERAYIEALRQRRPETLAASGNG